MSVDATFRSEISPVVLPVAVSWDLMPVYLASSLAVSVALEDEDALEGLYGKLDPPWMEGLMQTHLTLSKLRHCGEATQDLGSTRLVEVAEGRRLCAPQ